MRERNDIIGTLDWQRLLGFIRLLLFFACLLVVGVVGGLNLDHIDPIVLADEIRQAHPLLQYIRPVIIVYAAVVNSLRYMILPLGAIIFVFIAGSLFVKDVYALRNPMDAVVYVLSSMFGDGYPILVVDKGEKQLSKTRVNLIDKIGGPGWVMIEPGNAVVFRHLRRPSRASVTSNYFLAPFETIGQTINLDEQQADRDQITTITREGIRVAICDIHFRYRIQQQMRGNAPARRTPSEPYPFSDEAMQNIAFSLSVLNNGPEKWNAGVERVVIGVLTDYIADHYLDELTAPRLNNANPRIDIMNELFLGGVRNSLTGMGAELLWIDIGHIEIQDEMIDDSRASVWATEWVEAAETKRAIADARRTAYLELGRAEAQAELIASMAEIISQSTADPSSYNNQRKLMLVRTAQILDALGSQTETKNTP